MSIGYIPPAQHKRITCPAFYLRGHCSLMSSSLLSYTQGNLSEWTVWELHFLISIWRSLIFSEYFQRILGNVQAFSRACCKNSAFSTYLSANAPLSLAYSQIMQRLYIAHSQFASREELQSVQRELEVLSEQYSQKCLENAHLAQALEAERQALRQCQRENQELNAHNQFRSTRCPKQVAAARWQSIKVPVLFHSISGTKDAAVLWLYYCCLTGTLHWVAFGYSQSVSQSRLISREKANLGPHRDSKLYFSNRNPGSHSSTKESQKRCFCFELNNRLAAEITRLRTLLTGEGGVETAGSPLTQGKDAYELEVLLRVKESEIQYLKQEISSLKDELQTALRVMFIGQPQLLFPLNLLEGILTNFLFQGNIELAIGGMSSVIAKLA
ncbi:Myosin phosphatase Rho-interacting protein [Varanus komodoensis]|nr:Myosin phosphatase Rho-interacting protein [Varanus komodoensis]